jgi:hypothetical protein
MLTSIFTDDNNIYKLSNDINDKADRFIAHENILYIFPKDFGNPFLYNLKAAIAVPYYLVTSVIYHDKYGEALSDYIWYKKGIGKSCLPPIDPPLSI